MNDYFKHMTYVVNRLFLYIFPDLFDDLSFYIKYLFFPLFLFISAYIIVLLIRRVRGV